MNDFLWAIFPYICLIVFVGGLIWRYRYDQFGWTTRSSEIYEKKLLAIGSPLFHFGILGVAVGHFMGLVIPESWTDAVGISEKAYHAFALGGGIVFGLMTLVGLIILVFRRRTTQMVFTATTNNDKLMYLVLGIVIATGIWNTTGPSLIDGYNCRTTVSEWFRSIFWFHPDTEAISHAPISFRIHGFCAFLLFALWPFTRLVHVFSAPIGYLVRPALIYRSRGTASGVGLSGKTREKVWERPGLGR